MSPKDDFTTEYAKNQYPYAFYRYFFYYTYCLKKCNDIGCLYLLSSVKKKTPV